MGPSVLNLNRSRIYFSLGAMAFAVSLTACSRTATPAGHAPQAMPVKTETVALEPVPVSDTYVATIKSRRSATIQPQVSGNIFQIFVHSGQRVTIGQRMMEIDFRQQQAIVAQQQASEQQALALYQFNQQDIVRQKSLFTAGIISKQAYQQANQSYN